jgi:hypothetical protein
MNVFIEKTMTLWYCFGFNEKIAPLLLGMY